jgi:hypothetical protein
MLDNKNKASLAKKLVIGLACLQIGLVPQYSFAIDPPPPPAATSEVPQPNAPAPQAPKFTQAELETLLAPIALYPDALLAQLLPAAAYPLDIVQAERWLDKNKTAFAKQDFSGADAEDWDLSVKAMLRFPAVLKKISDDLDWTTSLGDAIVNQPQDVANVIQLLRDKAKKAGTLKTTNEQVVTTQKQDGRDVVTIQSPDPSVVYVPSYDPEVVYNPPSGYDTGAAIAAGLLTFGAAVAIGSAWRGNYWNWNTGVFYPPVWPGNPAWRPPYAGWRPGMPIGGGGTIGIGDRPWRPDGGRYRPGGRPQGAGSVAGRVLAVVLAAGQVSVEVSAAGRVWVAALAVQSADQNLERDPRQDLERDPRLDMGNGLQYGQRTGQLGVGTGAAVTAALDPVTADFLVASTAAGAASAGGSTVVEAVFTAAVEAAFVEEVEAVFAVGAGAADGDPI